MFRSAEREEMLVGRKISDLRGKTHLPGQLVDLAESVLKRQIAARKEAILPEYGVPETAPLERVAQGAPLLAREVFPFDRAQAASLFSEFAGLLAGLGGPAAQAAGVVLQEGEALAQRAFDAYRNNDEAFFGVYSGRFVQAPRIVNFLAQSGMTPSLRAFAEQIHVALPKDRTWSHGTCPVCGSFPFHSTLSGTEGIRVNHCSFCRASYRTFRLQCPYCHERDPAKLPFFTADEEPGYRVDACLTCKGYIKTTDFREFDRASLAELDDLESMALDMLAVKRGFSRPVASSLGF